MSFFVIRGGKKLKGTAKVNTSKNAAVVLLNAALLNHGKTRLLGVPKIEEVYRIIEVLQSIGITIRWTGASDVTIERPKRLRLLTLDYQAAIRTRSVLFLLGVLMHEFSSFRIPQPGGCRLGKRTVRPHLYALEHFGVRITAERKFYRVRVSKPSHQREVVLYESGDTVTENVLMAAALTPGITVMKYASANYQVQELCFLLEKFGVKITGIGTTTLVIHGVSRVAKDVTYALAEDPIEAMLFISLAATTHSGITIRGCPIDFLELELLKLEKMGFRYTTVRRYLARNKRTRLVDIKTAPSRLVALEEKVYGRPYPGLNMDNLPFFVPIATQARGTTLIHDWAYEERAIYFTELNRLGASITLADPHRVFVNGPTKLRANELMCPPALRPAVIIAIAMLAAEGESILRNVYSIDRGYENLCDRLRLLGADINRVDEVEQ